MASAFSSIPQQPTPQVVEIQIRQQPSVSYASSILISTITSIVSLILFPQWQVGLSSFAGTFFLTRIFSWLSSMNPQNSRAIQREVIQMAWPISRTFFPLFTQSPQQAVPPPASFRSYPQQAPLRGERPIKGGGHAIPNPANFRRYPQQEPLGGERPIKGGGHRS